MLEIRNLAESDRAAWFELWQQYIAFYEAGVPSEVSDLTWRRLLDPASGLVGRVAVVEGSLAGFSNSVIHPGTWRSTPVCYLEDLYVDSNLRGRGIGHALISDLLELSKAMGWSQLYWHTRQSNAAARKLYDRFASADDFVRYRLIL